MIAKLCCLGSTCQCCCAIAIVSKGQPCGNCGCSDRPRIIQIDIRSWDIVSVKISFTCGSNGITCKAYGFINISNTNREYLFKSQTTCISCSHSDWVSILDFKVWWFFPLQFIVDNFKGSIVSITRSCCQTVSMGITCVRIDRAKVTNYGTNCHILRRDIVAQVQCGWCSDR